MHKVRVNLGERSYDAIVGFGAIVQAGEAAAAGCKGRRAVIVSNPVVASHHSEPLVKSLSNSGFETSLVTIPAGEEHKTLDTVRCIYEKFIELKMDRSGVVVTLGGGVVGDMAGFAAATFMRGMDFVQVPTTLLAQVDASVGGKTGVDLPQGKNLVGAFHQPRAVVIDTATLLTLPEREFRAGLAEVAKHGIITDPNYFEFIKHNSSGLLALEPDLIDYAVFRSVEIKADVVSRDEKETTSLRKTLNLGHTFAHGLETTTGYSMYLHGEAVAIGLVAASDVAEAIGIAEKGTSERICDVLVSLGLPTVPGSPVDVEAVMSSMLLDKKASAGKISFVLPKRVGEVVVTSDVPEKAVREALRKWQ